MGIQQEIQMVPKAPFFLSFPELIYAVSQSPNGIVLDVGSFSA